MTPSSVETLETDISLRKLTRVPCAAELAIAAERAQLRLIGYLWVDRAHPLNQRVRCFFFSAKLLTHVRETNTSM